MRKQRTCLSLLYGVRLSTFLYPVGHRYTADREVMGSSLDNDVDITIPTKYRKPAFAGTLKTSVGQNQL